MSEPSLNSFSSRQVLRAGNKDYSYYSLYAAERNGLPNVSRLPFSLKVIIENMLRNEDGRSTSKADIEDASHWKSEQGLGGKGNRLQAGPGIDAGFHRRSGSRRPCRHARRDEEPRRRSAKDQSARAG